MAHGKGIQMTESGDGNHLTLYQGFFKNGLYHGLGKAYYLETDTRYESYSGYFKMGKRHGNGVLKLIDPSECQIEGKFVDDELPKYVKYTDKSTGEVYEGGFKGELPSGSGKYYFPDGKFYEGEFKRGLKHGHGTMLFDVKGVRKYEGNWKKGNEHGQGMLTEGNTSFEGEFKHGMKNGYFTITDEQGHERQIYYENDMVVT